MRTRAGAFSSGGSSGSEEQGEGADDSGAFCPLETVVARESGGGSQRPVREADRKGGARD